MTPRVVLLITAVCAGINAVIFAVGAPCYLLDFSELCNYPCQHDCEAALGLARYGELVRVDDPTQPFVTWPPVWGFVLYPFLALTNESSVLGGVVLNILILYGSALLVGHLVENDVRGYGIWAMMLVLFNPNAIAIAHLPRGETANAALIAVAFVILFYYLQRRNLRLALALGVVLGFATLFRPNTQYLVVLLPIVLATLVFLGGFRRWPARPFLHGVAALVAAAAVMSPWLYYMTVNGQTLRLASYDKEYEYFSKNVGVIDSYRQGLSMIVPTMEPYLARENTELVAATSEWDQLDRNEQVKRRLAFARHVFFSQDPADYVVPVIHSAARFFLTGGEGYLNLSLKLEGDLADPDSRVTRVGLVVTEILGKGFALATRVLGLLGVIYLIWRRDYAVLALILGAAAYFMGTALLVGFSRFRLQVDVPLLVLATYGLAYVGQRWQNRKSRSEAISPLRS